jgi:type I restriction enzyme S subunit
MKNGWQGTMIDEVCDITSSKRIYRADYEAEGVPFYRGKEIIEKQRGVLDVSTELFISEEKFQAIEEKFGAPHPGDLLLTSVGTLGVPYIVQPGERFYFKDGNLTWFRNLRNIDNRFLYYWLLSPMGKAQLGRSTIGSSQPALTIVLLKQMEIDLPNFPTQRKIAAILSAYDDLIENNLRRIKILEEMAQAIYREWFVKFRFPGHEKVRMVDFQRGKIPEGWDVTMLGELVEIQKGKKPKTLYTVFEDGLVPYLLIDVMKGGDPKYTNPEKTVMAKQDDILMIMDGASSGIAMIGVAGAVGSTLARFRPFDKNALSTFLLLFLLRHKEEEIRTKNVGSAIPHANKDYITSMEVSVPTKHINKDFDGCCRSLFSYILNLSKKNVTLRRTRDLLLPKLIFGELDVSDLDIKTGGHMQ